MRGKYIIFTFYLFMMSCGIFGSEPETSKTFANATKVVIIAPDIKCSQFDVDNEPFKFGTQVDGKVEIGISGSKRVVAAIFKTKPQEQAGSILNNEDIVWMWTSGMRSDGRALEGKINLVDGVKTNENGEPIDPTLTSCKVHRDRGDKDAENYCVKLDYRQLYWFAVWAYNENREISYWTDMPMPFFVKCPLDKTDCPKPERYNECK
ncbi:MAG: hypothetical protein N2746_01470 [Deltaproteobacteria bacterium]|nr:hypothetical protein [Deltaproteobacteria bacterium]